MKHVNPEVIERKEDENEAAGIITKALADLQKSVDDRLKAVETKGLDDATKARLDAIETTLARPAIKTDEKADMDASRKAFVNYLRLGNQTPVDEIKTLTVSNDASGGYLAPAEMSTEFIRDLVEVSPIRGIASVRNTSAPSVKYPKRGAGTSAAWEGETEDSAESTVAFGQLEVTARKLTTYVDISNELLADSAGAAEQEVRLALADDFGKAEALGFVNGAGIKSPEGFMVNPDIAYFANGDATVLSADALIALMFALPAEYRNRGSWVMNGTTLGIVRTLKDGGGNYVWQPGLQAGQPSTLLGLKVVEAVDMPDVASGTFPIAFGDFNAGYRVLDRLAMSILSDPYTQATKGVTRLHAARRVGGRVIQPAALRKLKMAVS